MNLNTENWKTFYLRELFGQPIRGTRVATYDRIPGNVPFVTAGGSANGVSEMIGNEEIPTFVNAITIDMFGNSFYHGYPFKCDDNILVLQADFLNVETGIFISSILTRDRYKNSYGRQYRQGSYISHAIKLPVVCDQKNRVVVDKDSLFSSKGYIPDFDFMKRYMKTLHHKPLTTIHSKRLSILNTESWKPFLLHRVFNACMGNGIDAALTTESDPRYLYVSRGSNWNGVAGFIDEIDGEQPFPAGAMSLALGGSLGSCFIQHAPFYTAQNVAVLQEKVPLPIHTKLFIATLIRNECKVKYQTFGRELNSHFRKDFILKLPVLYKDGQIATDNTCEFSDEGWIPDWQWMENYMKSLPYGERV